MIGSAALRRAFRFAGIDQAVFYSLLNRTSAICFSVVTLALVVTRFSPEQQGYYYTFTSLLVLQSLLELGMGVVLVQFLSHEWGKLRLDPSQTLQGDGLALDRVAGLVAVGVRWYGGASLAFLLIVGSTGTVLLTRQPTPPGVIAPWWLLCAAVSVSILQVPLRCCLEGSDQVARVQKTATGIYCCASFAGWIGILAGLGLYALAMTAGTTAILGLTLYGRASRPFLRLARQDKHAVAFSWRREFWPQQWRIALSFICGFCVFQSFVPILFVFQGPAIAGRMGASVQLYNAINSVSMSWVTARSPQFGIMGAQGRMAELRAVVRTVLIRSTLLAGLCAILVLAGMVVIKVLDYRSDRFLGLESLALLLLAVIVMQRSNVETTAVRFQKIEPFVLNSVVSAVLMLLSNILLSKYFGAFAVCAGFTGIVTLLMVPWIHRIYEARLGSASGA